MQEPIRRSIANAVEWQLEQLENEGYELGQNIDLLVGLLEKAVSWDATIDLKVLRDFMYRLLNIMSTEGPGGEFRRQREFIAATNIAIERLAAEGKPTADLRLAQASYYSNIATNGVDRRHAIQQAIAASDSPDEYLEAMVTMAKYLIDISYYPQARVMLDECRSRAASADSGPIIMPDILMTRGVSYFYSDLHRAETYFSQAIHAAQRALADPRVGRAAATAYHYLGRIKAAERDWPRALYYMTQGRDLANTTRGGEAYYHLRLAEVLIEAGTISEARYHLARSSELFEVVQQSSIGQVQFDLVLARLNLACDDEKTAKDLLKAAVAVAREHSYPRGELQGLIELLRLDLSRGALFAASRLVIRGMVVFARTELKGALRHPVITLKTVRRFLPRSRGSLRGSGQQPAVPQTIVHCPCGSSHEQIQPSGPDLRAGGAAV